jgi:hypothetical protein
MGSSRRLQLSELAVAELSGVQRSAKETIVTRRRDSGTGYLDRPLFSFAPISKIDP